MWLAGHPMLGADKRPLLILTLIPSWLVVWLPFSIFPLILGIIIPIDFHIFQRGSNHQPSSQSHPSHSRHLVKIFHRFQLSHVCSNEPSLALCSVLLWEWHELPCRKLGWVKIQGTHVQMGQNLRYILIPYYEGFQKWGYPTTDGLWTKKALHKMDDLGYPYDLGNLRMLAICTLFCGTITCTLPNADSIPPDGYTSTEWTPLFWWPFEKQT